MATVIFFGVQTGGGVSYRFKSLCNSYTYIIFF